MKLEHSHRYVRLAQALAASLLIALPAFAQQGERPPAASDAPPAAAAPSTPAPAAGGRAQSVRDAAAQLPPDAPVPFAEPK